MAIKKSTYTGGNGRSQLPSPYVANVATEVLITHNFREAIATTDILELAYLPAYCRILDATIVAVGTGDADVDVGFMTGEVGSPDADRTSGDEIFDGVTPTTETSAPLIDLAGLASSEIPRSIGVVFTEAVSANPANRLVLRLRYATGS
ncbi:hypothetical protein SAMN04489859_102020 [Paracoccus alcaliphilus]|uniref:Uncharacterized protein n=1 Tax=Paracoccus alcaliphilus TaxID=34002 RepID=A0A1H8K3Z2_9RHOB|nr:hypothetical protein [Paracoccus alcaliphilus]WCR17517.1 hypothetical protein JHW40_14435 [Paracoccus alcaliphilus]SEN87216.1 hypothetical protein SAMN04489859_102020 [Paracoccus alcaliphilus]